MNEEHSLPLARITAELGELTAKADLLKVELDDTIRAAVADGESVIEIAKITGLSRPRIYQIRDNTR